MQINMKGRERRWSKKKKRVGRRKGEEKKTGAIRKVKAK